MKAKHCLFHIECFRCVVCDTMLRKGDLFGMSENNLFCKLHYELLPPHVSNPSPDDPVLFSPGLPPTVAVGSQFPPHGFSHSASPFGVVPPAGDPWYPPTDFVPGPMSGGGSEDFAYENNNEPMLKKRRGRKKRKVESGKINLLLSAFHL